jgi:hypothetical protein
MGTTFRYLAVGDEAAAVLDWFRAQPDPPEVVAKPYGSLLYFRALGRLAQSPDGSGVDVRRSPLVSLFGPTRKRGILWTAGEVHFLPTPLRLTFPVLHSLSRRFGRWLSGFDRVFSQVPTFRREWDYYLEGSLRNYDVDIYSMPQAMGPDPKKRRQRVHSRLI